MHTGAGIWQRDEGNTSGLLGEAKSIYSLNKSSEARKVNRTECFVCVCSHSNVNKSVRRFCTTTDLLSTSHYSVMPFCASSQMKQKLDSPRPICEIQTVFLSWRGWGEVRVLHWLLFHANLHRLTLHRLANGLYKHNCGYQTLYVSDVSIYCNLNHRQNHGTREPAIIKFTQSD